MEKPFSLRINELEESIVKIINEANIPAYCLKTVLQEIYQQIELLDNEEIKKYNEKQKEDK